MKDLSKRFPNEFKVRKWGKKKKLLSVLFSDHAVADAAIAIAKDHSAKLGYPVTHSPVIEEKLAKDPEIRAKMKELRND